MSSKFSKISLVTQVVLTSIVSLVNVNEASGQNTYYVKGPGDIAAGESNEIKIPSPTAAAFAEYVVNPVGYYTGVPQIKVDLHEIKLKDFVLPISLTYHAGGIKLDETPSNVGLNWNLSAIGVINRAVKDKPDDTSIEFCDEVWFYNGPCQNCSAAPPIEGNTRCGNGLLWILNPPANASYPNANYDGLPSYDIDINSFNGASGSATDSRKLLKKFYGVAIQATSQNMYLLPMADKEPDIFYFNFPGHTGQFVFDVSTGTAKAKVVPYQDIDIGYTIDAQKKLSAFKITDEQGVVYYFNAVETTDHMTIASASPIHDGLDAVFDTLVVSYETGSSIKKFNSSWFLTRIETPSKQYLDFTYADEEHKISSVSPQQTGMKYYNPATNAATYDPNGSGWGYHMSLSTNEATIKTKRITSIENNELRVSFNATHQRQDLASGTNVPYAIDEIIVYNKIGTLARVKKFKLMYDYFTSTETAKIMVKYTFNVTDTSKYYKRLRLLSCQEFGSDDTEKIEPYRFEYKYFDFTGNNSHKLPHRLSYQQDIWGFYNAATNNNTLIPAIYVYPDMYTPRDSRQFSLFKKNTFTGVEHYIPGADRLPNSTTQDIGMITKVRYPTGGYTTYQFEPHAFRFEGQDYSGGGLRIKQVVKSDNENSSSNIVYDYSYLNATNTSSGAIISMPIVALRDLNMCCGFFPSNPDDILSYKIATIRFSSPQSSLASTNGSFIGYRTVTESISGNGKTVFAFSMPATWGVENDKSTSVTGGVCNPQTEPYCDGFYQRTPVVDIFVPVPGAPVSTMLSSTYDFRFHPASPNTFPFPDNPNYDWQRGHLLSEKVYDNNARLLKETSYVYTNYFPNNQTSPTKVYGYKFGHHYPRRTGNLWNAKGYAFRVAKYTILTDVTKKLLTKKETLYNPDDVAKSFWNSSTFSYENTSHCEITKTVSLDSRGKVVKIVNAYAGDLSGTTLGSDLLRQNHINNLVVRQQSYLDDVIVSKNETQYELKYSMVLPTSNVTYSDGTTESSRIISDYDAQGNIIRLSKAIDSDPTGNTVSTGANKAYIWGYNGTLPIAETASAKNNQVYHTSFEDITGGNIVATDSRTGDKCWNGTYSIPTAQRPVSGNYTITYWEKIGTGSWILKTQTVTNAVPTQITSTGKIDEVRIFPPGSMMTTFTYAPLIGMTSKTDVNNKTEQYKYDKLGRLKLVLDFEGNVIKHYRYNYQLNK